MAKKIVITIEENTLSLPAQWEETEDDIRNLLLETFGGKISGTIENEFTGNTVKIDAPRCPHCGKPVLYLENEQDLLCVWKMYPNGDYSPVPDMERMTHLGDINRWVCPHCGKVIAETEEDALDFLNGD